MAGDWIKMRVDLTDDPAVIAISEMLGMDEFSVIGRLHKLWTWADRHTTDGCAVGATVAFLNRYMCATGFAEALVSVGWLTINEDGISIPNFDRHNGESAKKRALSAKRMKRLRCAPSATVAQPEKRREEKRDIPKGISPLPPKGGFDESQIDFPNELNSPEVRKSVSDWLAHHRQIGKPYKSAASVSTLLRKWRERGPAAFVAAVEHSIGNNYQGLFPPGDANGKPQNRHGSAADPSRIRGDLSKYDGLV